MRTLSLILSLQIISFFSAEAHVALTTPTGGETFIPGQTISISWQVVISHNTLNWDLFFSTDGGATWNIIQADISEAALSYEWTVPDINTNQAKIRVVQDNVDSDYSDDSDNFTIAAPTGTGKNNFEPEWSISPNPFNETARLNFENPEQSSYTFTLINSLGQAVRIVENIVTDQLIIEKGNLAEGLYFFQLSSGNAILVSDRLVVK
ncbi:MAG: T9SS type A sorting domain-containing protein [Bacteroidales bacterium]|nr:T9SS type A sorting domain-containing protein [Bacteroidales bacterium]MCF8389502.1 T9SS type A sorting domain-containing protein [Bacteroidales bacterium]